MNKIFNDDAISIMDRMIANEYKVDLLITDPPYKITARGNGGNSGGMFQKKEVNNGKIFKTNDLEIEDWLPRFYNILKDNSHCYIMTNNKNITNYLKVINEMYFNEDKKQKFHFSNDKIADKLENLVNEIEILASNSNYPQSVDLTYWNNFIINLYK